jgi:DMSO/TMAO reductase YedYZ molybdopterin-dependent catalytic subunit
MQKTKKTILVAGTIIAVLLVAVAASYYLMPVQNPIQSGFLPSGQPPQAQIKFTGEIATEKTLTVNDLSRMPLKNVTNTIKGETASYIGVTLLDALNRTDAPWDAGLINVAASDGYNKTLNIYQAWNSTQYPGSEIILAFAKNGQWMTNNTGGPIELITPGLASGYNVKSVSELRLEPWTINVSGNVSAPLVLTGENITSFGTQTVEAAFAPGGEPQRTSNWTGTGLRAILQAAGISENASKITVDAIDGYSRDFTVAQVHDLSILIGFKENGDYFPPVMGQPFRLIVPAEDFKWGQNWVRWVSKIEVS